MRRRELLAGLSALSILAACGAPAGRIGADGLPVRQVYRITPEDEQQIPYRVLDGVNTLRQAAGRSPLSLDAQLTAAAATHSQDMARQNRPWNFGSDGSSALDRIRRVGYQGGLVGEAIAETYETELETLAAWMENPLTRDVVLDPTARRLGVSWFQEPAGKIWWTMVIGS
ncbi:CAP domain-containing protein [Wenxinia marina]|uniref:Cysteine-rich secretory protein family n=1 Tax=Wenxinia marina DSM 24838 TaxID=1123501 RepID=A0A0D0QFD5_9RHOB|nr:CAP domain-containing protein [Wenxinia marina]KIQ71027.1 Cysteine-rich secretory protein family [Wenxinia marina DSM 24838]GGL55470.1 serine protease [Wenxinia marina]